MKQIFNYSFDQMKTDRDGVLSDDQKTRARAIFAAKTARANYYTQLKTDDNKKTFSIYGAKKINGTYNETKYIFGASGVLRVEKYDAATNKSSTLYYLY